MTDALFEHFTERAKRVLTLAQEEARGFNHNYIGQEHLLLALIRVEDGVAARALVALGVTQEMLRKAVEYIVGRGSMVADGEIGLTPRAKKALELAAQQALRLNSHYVGTEHLLLGLIAEGTGVGAGVLASLGVTAERARDGIIRAIAESEPPSEHTERPASATGEPSETATRPPLDNWFAQWQEREKTSKRYSLVLPESLYNEVQELSDREQTTVVEVMRRFIKLGLLATRVQATPNASLIIREGDREREILLL
jgi:ATP-dependent Clp protease ATP-binding subunit ClpA